MARKPTKRTEFVLFDVIYEDGSQRSNRRVPGEALAGLEGDDRRPHHHRAAGPRDRREVRPDPAAHQNHQPRRREASGKGMEAAHGLIAIDAARAAARAARCRNTVTRAF